MHRVVRFVADHCSDIGKEIISVHSGKDPRHLGSVPGRLRTYRTCRHWEGTATAAPALSGLELKALLLQRLSKCPTKKKLKRNDEHDGLRDVWRRN